MSRRYMRPSYDPATTQRSRHQEYVIYATGDATGGATLQATQQAACVAHDVFLIPINHIYIYVFLIMTSSPGLLMRRLASHFFVDCGRLLFHCLSSGVSYFTSVNFRLVEVTLD